LSRKNTNQRLGDDAEDEDYDFDHGHGLFSYLEEMSYEESMQCGGKGVGTGRFKYNDL